MDCSSPAGVQKGSGFEAPRELEGAVAMRPASQPFIRDWKNPVNC